MRFEATQLRDRAVVTRGQRLVAAMLLDDAADELEKLSGRYPKVSDG
jgi:hypothetical protein